MPRSDAANLKSPVDAAESGERLADGFDRNLKLEAHGNRRGRIQHVVRAGNVQTETAQIPAAKFEMKFAGHVAGGGMRDAQIGLRAGPISNDAAVHGGQNLLDVFVVDAENRQRRRTAPCRRIRRTRGGSRSMPE